MTIEVRALPQALPALTGLRGIAACWVLLYHVDGLLGSHLPGVKYFWFFKSGFRGVDLFFLLSGFVLMHANGDDFRRFRVAELKRFAVLRFTRIYPLNTVVLGLIVTLVFLSPSYHDSTRALYTPLGFFETLTLSNRWLIKESGAWNGPTWSLSYEVLAYMVFPLLAWLTLKNRSATRCVLVVVGLLGFVAAYQFLTGHLVDNRVWRLAILRAVLTFVAGVALHSLSRLTSIRRPCLLAWLSCILIVLLTIFPKSGLLMPFGFAGLILVSTYEGVLVNRALSGKTVLFLGRISFSLYLIHFKLLDYLEWLLDTKRLPDRYAWLYLAICVISSFVLAIILNLWIERPSQKFGRRLTAKTLLANVHP